MTGYGHPLRHSEYKFGTFIGNSGEVGRLLSTPTVIPRMLSHSLPTLLTRYSEDGRENSTAPSTSGKYITSQPTIVCSCK